jgi:hypothetical protein
MRANSRLRSTLLGSAVISGVFLFLLTFYPLSSVLVTFNRSTPPPPFRCSSSLAPKTVSTRRDLIWTIVLKFDRWFDLALLSIRMCGCRARIVLLTETDVIFESHFARVLEMTETEVWRKPVEQLPIGRLRFHGIVGFLNGHRSEFDYVLMCNAQNAFFHRDPFEILSVENAMVFVGQGELQEESSPHSMWLYECYDDDQMELIKQKEVICSETVFGPSEQFLMFAELVLSEWPGPSCSWDQPIVNYLLYTGAFEKIGIQTKSYGCDGPVLTVASCPQEVKAVGGVAECFNGKSEIPYMTQLWNHLDAFKDMYFARCDMSEYMQRFSALDLNWSAPGRW